MKITSKILWNENTFEVVDKIPENYFVWNIGSIDGYEEYIPVCELLYPKTKGCYDINPLTLKAIKLPIEEVHKLMKAAKSGVNSLKSAERALKNSRSGYSSEWKRKKAKITIEIFKIIS